MRILHIRNTANVASILARNQRELGNQVLVAAERHRYHLEPDIVISSPSDSAHYTVVWNLALWRLSKYIAECDVVHIHGGISKSLIASLCLKLRNPRKVFVVHLHGSDARTGRGLHYLFLADKILYSTPDLSSHVKNGVWIPNPIEIPSCNPSPKKPGIVRFGHFPTKRELKGTKSIIRGFIELKHPRKPKTSKQNGISIYSLNEVELVIVEALSRQEALSVMKSCDVVIDQISPFGTYGQVSLEAMAAGKVVMCSFNPKYYSDIPIVRINTENLREQLEDILARRDEWHSLGKKGEEYVMKYHDPVKVARRILEIYQEAIEEKRIS